MLYFKLLLNIYDAVITARINIQGYFYTKSLFNTDWQILKRILPLSLIRMLTV